MLFSFYFLLLTDLRKHEQPEPTGPSFPLIFRQRSRFEGIQSIPLFVPLKDTLCITLNTYFSFRKPDISLQQTKENEIISQLPLLEAAGVTVWFLHRFTASKY